MPPCKILPAVLACKRHLLTLAVMQQHLRLRLAACDLRSRRSRCR
jgi:hypothetical protein